MSKPARDGLAMVVGPVGVSRRELLRTAGGIITVLGAGWAARAFAQARTPVTISEAVHLGMYVSVYAANRRGSFAKHGLDVTVTSAGGIALPVPVLLSGKGQISVTGAGMAVNATLEGGKMKTIAKIVGGVAMWAVARPGTQIRSVEDFKGKTIATLRYPSSTIQVPTYTMKVHGGFDPNEHGVKFLQQPPGAQVAAVKDGRADLATLFEWDVSIALKQFGLQVAYSFADVIGPLSWTTSFVTEEYLGKNPQIVQAYCNALAEAQKLLHTDRNVFVEVSRQEFPNIDAEVIRSAADNFLGARHVVPRNPIITKAEWDTDMKLELEGGSIKRALPFEQMVDNSFAEKATERYGLRA